MRLRLLTQDAQSSRDRALPAFQSELLPVAVQWLNEDSPSHLQDAALCFLVDMTEFGGEAARPLEGTLLHALGAHVEHKDPQVRMTALYGYGMLAEFGSDALDPVVPQLCQLFLNMVASPKAREEDELPATDNAVSALFKFVLFRPHAVGGQGGSVVAQLLPLLPLVSDKTESRTLNSLLAQAAHAQSTPVVGEDWANLPALLAVFADVLAYEGDEDEEEDVVSSDRTDESISQWLKAAQGGSVPADKLKNAWQRLSGEQRTALQEATL